MFKKLKDKIAEESQTKLQQLAQVFLHVYIKNFSHC